jgi:uncharacterized protein YacL
MRTWIIRGVFIILCGVATFHLAGYVPERITFQRYLITLAGVAVAAGLVVAVERSLKKSFVSRFVPPAIGLIVGLVIGYFLTIIVVDIWLGSAADAEDVVQSVFWEAVKAYLTIGFMLLFGQFGLILGVTKAPAMVDVVEQALLRGKGQYHSPKILDTSVIIDGRIADICDIGFIEGTLIVPRFVLRELQNIADSADSLRRARGRRGLDMLNRIQDDSEKVDVEIYEIELERDEKVDTKLVELAKRLDAKVITNDFNLNKVAQIDGVSVLNVNDLANAVKPAVLPDEQLVVKVLKEGKEAGQGIGYLDDGTMVVVDGGKFYMGREIRVVVTSVLQTAAGKMIFAKTDKAASSR